VIADGVIRSDGTTVLGGDDKSGVAAILEALTCIIESGAPRPDLTVILSVCEELSVYGARFLPDDLFPVSTLCLVLDAEGTPGGITIAAPYHCSFHAIFHGTSAHAGVNPEDGCNALQMAAKAVTLMELGRIDDRTTASVGIVSGGSAVNIVPDTCVLDGECRSIDETRVEEVKRAMTDAMHAGAAAYGGTAEVAWELAYKGLSYREDDPDVQLLLDTARACGLTGYTAMSGGGSDANVLSPKGAKPLVLNTGMTDFHSIHESLKVSDLEDCARYVESIVEAVARRG